MTAGKDRLFKQPKLNIMETTHSVLCDNCHAALDADTPYQLDYAMTSEGWHTTTEGSEYCPNCCTVEENGNLVIGLKLK